MSWSKAGGGGWSACTVVVELMGLMVVEGGPAVAAGDVVDVTTGLGELVDVPLPSDEGVLGGRAHSGCNTQHIYNNNMNK